VALPWVRLDCAFPRNHKLLAMLQAKDGYRAAVVYVCSLSYSGEQGTAGWVPDLALPFLHGRKTEASLLVNHGFWEPKPGGWIINGWEDFQGAGEEAKRRSERAQHAAYVRWHGQNGDGSLCPGQCPGIVRDAYATDGRTDGLTETHLAACINPAPT
jgi:hypothetical protein